MKRISIFLKRKKIIFAFIAGILVFPVIVNFMMKISFGAEGDENTWILFWGSLGGGIITLIGVFLTLLHNRNERKSDDIKKIIIELITSLNSSNIYLVMQTLISKNLSDLGNNIYLTKLELNRHNQNLLFNNIKMQMITVKHNGWQSFKEMFGSYVQKESQIIENIIKQLDNLQQIIDKQEKMDIYENMINNYNRISTIGELTECEVKKYFELKTEYDNLKQELFNIQGIITNINQEIRNIFVPLQELEKNHTGDIINLSKIIIKDIENQII